MSIYDLEHISAPCSSLLPSPFNTVFIQKNIMELIVEFMTTIKDDHRAKASSELLFNVSVVDSP